MGRPPLPTKLHEIKGSYDKDPQRRRHGEPEPRAALGPPPGSLDDHEKEIWNELVSISIPGVLGNTDRWAVEIAVKLMAELRTEGALSAGNLGQLLKCLSHLGMTPSDRAKLAVPGKKKDEWDDV